MDGARSLSPASRRVFLLITKTGDAVLNRSGSGRVIRWKSQRGMPGSGLDIAGKDGVDGQVHWGVGLRVRVKDE